MAKTLTTYICAPARFAFAVAVASVMALLCLPAHARAVTVDQLELNYQLAVSDYEDALVQKDRNKDDLAAAAVEIKIVEAQEAKAEQDLGEAAKVYYKHHPGRAKLMDMLISSSSLDEAIACYDYYSRIEKRYNEQLVEVREKRAQLEELTAELERNKRAIQAEIDKTKSAAKEAKIEWIGASHADGAMFHQKQGVDNNCGATAFTVAVNILLHEERFSDNVAVWSGPGFNGDSTTNLGGKAIVWLAANDLGDQIGVETISGDIRTTEQLKAELTQGHVVILSSGPGSVWRYVGDVARPGLFPFGHWIVFYNYTDGVFYANDSSVDATLGAGCPYTEEQMQQWLDGRGSHFAVSLYKKD